MDRYAVGSRVAHPSMQRAFCAFFGRGGLASVEPKAFLEGSSCATPQTLTYCSPVDVRHWIRFLFAFNSLSM